MAKSDESLVKTPRGMALQARQAGADDPLVQLWLHGRSPHTQRAYRSDAERFQRFADAPLHQITLGDLQAFRDSLKDLGAATQNRVMSAVKSLLTFGHKIGYLPFNVGVPVELPRKKERLSERILSEAEVLRLIALTPAGRNRTLLRLLYAAGVRVSELCALRWRDARPRSDGGQIAVFGKGGKTRVILLPETVWRDLAALKAAAPAAGPDDWLFGSQKRRGGAPGRLTPVQVFRIVRAAARRAEIRAAVSPHWFRHAHASHALDRGAPLHLVQATLGHASVVTTGGYLHARPNDSSARFLAL